MSTKLMVDSVGWGLLLWIIGYALGIVLFTLVPPSVIGWIIMPIGITLTLFILFKKIKGTTLKYFLILSIVWTFIAILGDYFFLVKAFKPEDGYYKLDVYLYYIVTFALPILVYFIKAKKSSPNIPKEE